MEEQTKLKKVGRKVKEVGAKTERVNIRITKEQKVFLEWAQNVADMTQADLLIRGAFSFCQEHSLFGSSYLMMRKLAFGDINK